MNVVPAFLRSAEKQEPAAPPLPRTRPEENRQFAMDFMNSHDRLLEENAWLRSENEQQRVELKVERESRRRLEIELNFVRDQLDRLQRHDNTMVAGVDHLVLIANKLLENSRAEAYAPPATGTQEQPGPLPEDAQQELAALVATIKPGERDA